MLSIDRIIIIPRFLSEQHLKLSYKTNHLYEIWRTVLLIVVLYSPNISKHYSVELRNTLNNQN